MGGSSKRGTKYRHRAAERLQKGIEGYDPIKAERQETFAPLIGESGSQLIQEALGIKDEVMDRISGLLDPNQALEMGLSAPGILDSLVARGQESSASNTRAAGQGMANMLPTTGGGAERAMSDLYRGAASDTTNMETGLRAQAAQEDLSNRLGLIQGSLGQLSGAGAGLDQILNVWMGGKDVQDSIAQLYGGQSGIAHSAFQTRQARDAANQERMYQQFRPMNSSDIGGAAGGVASGIGQGKGS